MSEKFGEKLKSERKAAKWTQEQLATFLSVTQSMISKWEKGDATPSYDNLIAISKVFNLPLTHFVNDDVFTKEELKQMASEKSEDLLSKTIEEFMEQDKDLYGDLTRDEILEALEYIKARRIMQRAKR